MPSGPAAQVRRLFERGFQHNLCHRWENVSLLRSEVERLAAEEWPASLSFDEQLEALNREQLEEPEFKAPERYEKIATGLNKSLFQLIRQAMPKIGALQVFKITPVFQFAGSERSTVLSFQLRRKSINTRHALRISLSLQRVADEIVPIGTIAGKENYLKPSGLFDPEAPRLLQAAMEQFILEALRESPAILDALQKPKEQL